MRMMNLNELLQRFPSEEACKAFLVQRRWPDGVTCPRCGKSEKIYVLKHKPFHWVCKNKDCGGRNGYRFSVITKTIFENTKYSLREWFRVAFIMLHSKKGISAHQIYRTFGMGSYETAWYMCTRLRSLMRGDVLPLEGEVEVDETYIGGKETNKHLGQRGNRGQQGKTMVIGAIARKGNVVCQAVNELGFTTQQDFVRKTVSGRVKLVATDEHAGYRNLGAHGFVHKTVSHKAKQYVVGSVHTNTIENFWSLLKRGIMGSYHHVSDQYLPLYLNEFSWRFNNRKNPNIFDALLADC